MQQYTATKKKKREDGEGSWSWRHILGSMLQLRTSLEEESRCDISQLRQAVFQNNARLLDEMLCQEVYKKVINCRGGWGVAGTPLHAAVSKGHLSCLQVLLGHGALVDCVDVKAQTPLFAAVRGKYLDCVLALLGAGANPNGNSSNNCSPVLTAAREGNAQILKELLRHGAEVNSRSKVLLWTSSARVSSGPLYLAAVYGHMECFKLLLLYGADPDYNCTDAKLLSSIKQPKTVLEMCLRHGCGVEYIQLLIDFGANVYLPTLIIEKSTKQNEAVELLLQERGNPKALTSQCRLAVRRYLKKIDKIQCIEHLDMPTSLINFLQHKPVPVPVL
ncbi:ankyrin repeat and SOCS box protein 12-like isoform X2 [Etheostoma cragini]|uniref:ankyrin repeat and SOCS box protein 12-like isoform X2 n=1 Tax=Etheostoma cragini TaxID=417921 RepID=UPI00155F4029|nr:ankyrin repeat and SOCS box protein 12-like isoform X2 [Etheostoma cragini]